MFRILQSSNALKNVTVYSAILQVFAFSVALTLTRLNHLHTRRSSTILLFFYPIYLAASLISVRTSFGLLGRGEKLGLSSFAVGTAHGGLVLLAWIMECFGPEIDDTVDGFVKVEASVKESPYETANLYSR